MSKNKKKERKTGVTFLKAMALLLTSYVWILLSSITAMATNKTADEAINWARSQVGHSVGYNDGSVKGATVKRVNKNYRTYTYNYWGCIRPNFKVAAPSVSFSSWDNDRYTYLRETDASIGQQIDVANGTCTEAGMYLYDANGKQLGKISYTISKLAKNTKYYVRVRAYYSKGSLRSYTQWSSTRKVKVKK